MGDRDHPYGSHAEGGRTLGVDVKMAGLRRVILRQGPTATARLQEMGLNSRQVQLMDYVREHGRITNRAYCGGPTELDRKPGAGSGALLGASCYAALGCGGTAKYTRSGVRPSSAEWGRPAVENGKEAARQCGASGTESYAWR